MRSLSQTLLSFVRWQTRAHILTLRFHFEWPPEIAALKARFGEYTWGRSLDPHHDHFYAIAMVSGPWPSDTLPELEAAIYSPPTSPDSAASDLEHYIALDLDSHAVIARLATLGHSREWTVLDEHAFELAPLSAAR